MASPADSAAPLALTFILPTRNRRAYVGRAIESCLQVHGSGVRVELLVVDGNSTDGSFEELQTRHGNDPRVKLIRQVGPKGFMAACFLAVPQVQTPFVTFMYDDDILSPFWSDLPREMKRRGADFGMGFSVEGELDQAVPFQRTPEVRLVAPSALLAAFLGRGRELSSHSLPYSPICCLTRTDRLNEWVEELHQFTGGRPLREYFMIERNAGPDLMIYLHSIASHAGEVVLLDGPVAQFSAHAISITSGLDHTDLAIGYWLAQLWLCGRLGKLRRSAECGWSSAYTVRQGVRLLLKRLRRGRGAWAGALLGETAALFARALTGPGAGTFLKGALLLLLPRRWRPQFGLSTRAEPLLT